MSLYYIHNVHWIDGQQGLDYESVRDILCHLHSDPAEAAAVTGVRYESVDEAMRSQPTARIADSALDAMTASRPPRYIIDCAEAVHAVYSDLAALRIIARSAFPTAHIDFVPEGSDSDAVKRAADTARSAVMTAVVRDAWTVLRCEEAN